MAILQFVDAPRLWLAAVGRTLTHEDTWLKPFREFVRVVAPSLVSDLPAGSGSLQLIEADLRAAGLVEPGDFGTGAESAGLLERKTTDLGRLLVGLACTPPVPLPPVVPRRLDGAELRQQERLKRQAASQSALDEVKQQREHLAQQQRIEAQQKADADAELAGRRKAAMADDLAAINSLFPTFPMHDLSEVAASSAE